MPPIVIPVVPLKFTPVIVSTCPRRIESGESAMTDGVPKTLNTSLVAVPPDVVTVIAADLAFAGTVIWMDVLVIRAPARFAGTFPNETSLTFVKFVPLMVMVSPTLPPVALSDEIVGASCRMLMARPTEVPPGVVTTTVEAPMAMSTGTVNSICVSVFDLMLVEVPPIATVVAPPRFVPVNVTTDPRFAATGATVVTLGAP